MLYRCKHCGTEYVEELGEAKGVRFDEFAQCPTCKIYYNERPILDDCTLCGEDIGYVVNNHWMDGDAEMLCTSCFNRTKTVL